MNSIGIGKSATLSRRDSNPRLITSINRPSRAPPRMPPQIACFSDFAAPPMIARIGTPATMLYDTYNSAPNSQWLAPASCWLAS